MTNWTNFITIAQFILLVAGIIGGYIVIRSTIAKSESEVQDRVREALSTENELLQSRLDRVEKDNRRLENLIQTIIMLLRKTHIDLEIDGNVVTIRSPSGTRTAQID